MRSVNSEGLATKSELFAITFERSVSLSEDKLQRWSEASLTAASREIPGTSQRGYTCDEIERILLVATIADQLDSDRPRVTEISYLLAYEGHDAPEDLVLQHLDEAVVGFQKLVLRLLTNRGARDLTLPGVIDTVAELVAKWICNRGDTRSPRGFAFEATRLFATTALYGILRVGTEKQAFQAFKRVVQWLFPSATHDATEPLWTILHEFLPFIRVDRENALLKAIRQACSYSEPVLACAALTKSALTTSSAVFPWMLAATPENTGGLCDEEGCKLVNRFLPAFITAVFIAVRSEEAARGRLDDLARGKTDDFVRDMTTIHNLAQDVRKRVS